LTAFIVVVPLKIAPDHAKGDRDWTVVARERGAAFLQNGDSRRRGERLPGR
jgi:hypothetical protein